MTTLSKAGALVLLLVLLSGCTRDMLDRNAHLTPAQLQDIREASKP